MEKPNRDQTLADSKLDLWMSLKRTELPISFVDALNMYSDSKINMLFGTATRWISVYLGENDNDNPTGDHQFYF